MSRHAINPVIDLIRDGWDDGDKWGSGIGALFELATVMDAAEIPVPGELEFRRSPVDNRTLEDMVWADSDDNCNDVSFNEHIIACGYAAGQVTERDMRLAALTLNRYVDACRAAGLDY